MTEEFKDQLYIHLQKPIVILMSSGRVYWGLLDYAGDTFVKLNPVVTTTIEDGTLRRAPSRESIYHVPSTMPIYIPYASIEIIFFPKWRDEFYEIMKKIA